MVAAHSHAIVIDGVFLPDGSIIGPLINPAFATRHLLGVYKPELLETVSSVAKEVGFTNAMFVHGLDGLDEISLLGKTRIREVKRSD